MVKRQGSTMRIAVMMVMLATPAMADDWTALRGDQIGVALTARVLLYGDGARQQFNADGTTLWEGSEANQDGRWRVTGDQYCSQWPPSDRWQCYDVAQDGLGIRFTAGDGSVSAGSYIDLQ